MYQKVGIVPKIVLLTLEAEVGNQMRPNSPVE